MKCCCGQTDGGRTNSDFIYTDWNQARKILICQTSLLLFSVLLWTPCINSNLLLIDEYFLFVGLYTRFADYL